LENWSLKKMMTPNFEAMTNDELKTYALKHRDDLTPLRVLFGRRGPNPPQYDFPDTEEGRAQMTDLLRRKFQAAERNPIDP
jgi:hypothetical protein